MVRNTWHNEAAIAARRARPRPEPAVTRARGVSESLRRIGARLKTLPLLDTRAPDELLGYDEHGLPR